MIKTIATEKELPCPNYEAIYRLRLKWKIEDLNKQKNILQTNLDNLNEQKAEQLKSLERLKNEQAWSYHMNNYFTDKPYGNTHD